MILVKQDALTFPSTSNWKVMSREVFNYQCPASRGQKGSAMRGSNDGPNWLLLAGGAAVTALSFVIGRRQKQYYEGGVEVQEGNLGKSHLTSHKGKLHNLRISSQISVDFLVRELVELSSKST